jgi:hypothetical protein
MDEMQSHSSNPTYVNEFHTDAGFVDAVMKFLWLQFIPEVQRVIVINCLKLKRKFKGLGSDGDAGARLEIELRNAWAKIVLKHTTKTIPSNQ